MKKLFLIFLLLILVIAGCSSGTQNNTGNVQGKENTISNKEPNTIEITSSGFSPNELKIKAGDKVTWVNKDTIGHWPASAVHPTHKAYPGSGIEKCGTNEQGNIFDACRDLNPGESWSFAFTQKGTWNYHDHTNLGKYGKIIVE